MSKKKQQSPKKENDSSFELLDLSFDLADFKKSSPPGKKKKAKKKEAAAPAVDPTSGLLNDLFFMDDTTSPRYNALSQSDDSGFGSGQANLEDVEEEGGHHTDIEQDGAGEVQGEFAMDMFIDPSNPYNKIVHTSLKSTIEKQKKAQAEVTQLRAEQLRDQGFGFFMQ